MNINLDNENLFHLFECASLVRNDCGLVGMDWYDLRNIYIEKDKMSFHTAAGDTVEQAYYKLNNLLKNKKCEFAFVFFKINENFIDNVDIYKLEFVLGKIASNCIGEETKIIYNIYTTDEDENCRIFLFQGNDI